MLLFGWLVGLFSGEHRGDGREIFQDGIDGIITGHAFGFAEETAGQFAGVPSIASAEQVTKLEEDRITAYFGSGHLLAIPSRCESLI